MLTRTRDTSGIHRRQCVACGFSGAALERAGQTNCPRCACDLTARKPMSYAEMEGIEATTPRAATRPRVSELEASGREWRLVERWLVFLFGAAIIGISVLALGAAAFIVR
ncbi:MAG: hypothetical protein DWI10_04620 [Planctomycetota bacterium]|nr:MAG: hypothetical protein DWI10_04620 [Planctomycetota bacterium]